MTTVININNKSSVNKKTNEHKNIILGKIEDISENSKLTSNEDIALTEPQAQPAPLVAKKSANSNLSGDAILKCLDCERIFNDQHINIDHEGVKYACNQCNQAILQGNLTKHLQSKHKAIYRGGWTHETH